GRLLDLSAGGLRFESQAEHATGDVLELHFNLPQGGPVTVRGEALRVVGRRTEDTGPRQYGLRFCDLDESVRVKIMTWVFAEQSRRFRDSAKPEVEA
ncbi:MAG TPA: PilZ domain-containing protein, partial [Myxococcota bacterium]|nr:PilZ domain-containing protein [Myxococcota bacterium]